MEKPRPGLDELLEPTDTVIVEQPRHLQDDELDDELEEDADQDRA